MQFLKAKSIRQVLIFGTLLIAITGAGCTSRTLAPEGVTTTVVLIRHAERGTISKELTEGGRARAAALPAAVADLDIVAIYSPDRSRNIDTAKPLAKKLGLKIILVGENPDAGDVARRLVMDYPGKTVLWVGNQGNLMRIFSRLGGTGEPPLEYGDLYIMHVPDRGDTRVIKKRFGNLYYD